MDRIDNLISPSLLAPHWFYLLLNNLPQNEGDYLGLTVIQKILHLRQYQRLKGIE